jgi:hypothetical protein
MSYDSTIGRWIAEDPIEFEGGDVNLYRYVGNGPTNFVDPNGLQALGPMRQNRPRWFLSYLPTFPGPPSKIDQLGNKIPIFKLGNPAYTKPRPGMVPIAVLGGNGYIGKIPPNTIVSVFGASPCVGLILIPKNPAVDPIYIFHFTPTDDPEATVLHNLPSGHPFVPIGLAYPDKGYIGYINGGNAEEGGDDALRGLQSTIKACRSLQIPIKGYVPAPNVGVDSNGNIYWTTPPLIPLEGYEP